MTVATRKPRIGVMSRDHFDLACFQLRLADPLSLLAGVVDTYFYKNIEQIRYLGDYAFEDDQHFVSSMDAFIIQRWFTDDNSRKLVELILKSGKPIVFEMDDWLPGLPSSNPMYDDYFKLVEHIEWLLPKCSLVTVTTPCLADKVRPINPNVRVIANALSRHRFVEPEPRDERVVIGFAGTSTHGRDLEMIAPALMRIHEEYAGLVRFVFWGNVPKPMVGKKDVRLVADGAMYHDYFPRLASLKLDIALAPLEVDGFNDSKSDLKWLDYSMVGAATVASDIEAYRHLKDEGLACVVANKPDAWFEAIAGLIDNEQERKAMAARARAHIVSRRTLEDTVGQYLDAWNSVLPESLRPAMPERLGKPMLFKSCPSLSDRHEDYHKWVGQHQMREVHAEILAERMVQTWARRPVFNLVTLAPKSKPKQLVHTLSAMEKQLYPYWRLVVIADWDMPDPVFASSRQLSWRQIADLEDAEAVAAVINDIAAEEQGDWLWLLPAGFRLQPNALARFGEAIHQHPEWQAIYCDSDVVSPMGERFLPALRPDFSPEYLRSMDYIGPALAFSASGVAALGGIQPYPGAYGYDLALRLFEWRGLEGIGHIDDILLSVPYREDDKDVLAHAARKVALENHAARLKLPVSVDEGYLPATHHFNIQLQGAPLVSIVIPTRDKLEYLEPCVESLFEKTGYQHFEVLIVDNQSEQPETPEYYQSLAERYGDRVRVLAYDAPFNFSAQCNLGARKARGEYLLLLNNDTEVILSSWLERMLALAEQAGVGCVGARLLYPEVGQIQHAGVVLGLPGGLRSVADHVFEPQDISESGYMKRTQTQQTYSALTGACLLVARDVYQAVGGMDESAFKVCFNDIDFCLKVQAAGLRNVYTPYAVMLHHHAKSVGKHTSDPRVALAVAVRERDEMDAMLRRWLPVLRRDPYFNRHMSLRGRRMELEYQNHVVWDPELPGRKRVLGMPVPGGSGEYRLSMPLSVLQEAGKLDGEIHQPGACMPSVAELARMAPDTLLLHMGITDAMLDAMGAYREFLPELRVVFGLDDLVGATPEKSNLHDHWKRHFPDAKQRLRRVLKLCDAMVVSTEPLAEFTRGMIGDVVVVPNRLRKTVWGELTSQRRRGKKPRVGWVGAAQHRGDLELLLEVIKATWQEVDWVFMGMCLPQFRPYVKEVHHGVSFGAYPETVAKLDLDLAVAPLELNAFNEAKSNLRLLEYGALGWPVVCTDIYPYQTNAAPVCRVPNDAAAWIAAIRERVHDLDASSREGDALRVWVRRHYWLEDHHEDWFRALQG